MITSAIKTTALLFGFLLLLSITVKNQPLFIHIYGIISPVTKYAQNETEKFFAKSFSSTQSYSKKIFENSVPKLKDSVQSKLSSRQKTGGEPAEKITHKEKKELDQLIKNH
jgi:hypothetical protein